MKITMRHTRGAALVEYGILVGLVAVVAIGAVAVLGGKVDRVFGTVQSTLASSMAGDAAEQAPLFVSTHGGVTIAATVSPDDPDITGYQGNHTATPHGSLVAVSGDIPGLDLFYYDAGNSRAVFIPTTDTRAVLAGKALSCEDGSTFNFDEADLIYYFGPNDNTQYRWDGVTGPSIVDGENFTCGIADQ